MISTSILKLQNDPEKIKTIDQSDTDFIHLDVMDGKFVSNKTSYRNLPKINKPLDIHFMVYDVKKYVDDYLYLKPQFMTFHLEINSSKEE